MPETRVSAPGPDEVIAIDIGPQSLATLVDLRDRFGNVVAVKTPKDRLALFINDPDAVRRLLVRHHANYRKGRGFERVEMLLGNGLIVSDGDTWRRSRTMIQPAFSRQNVHRLLGCMRTCTETVAQRFEEAATAGEAVNVTQAMSDFALELILRAIFGADYDNRIVQDGHNPFAFLSQDATRDLTVVMRMRRLRDLLLAIVISRREQAAAEQYDFLAMYIAATDKDGAPFSDQQLLDELMTLIVAGYETSAGTLNWAWYLLAHHPAVEEQLLDEARTCNGLLSHDADGAPGLTDMQYTQQVLEETLRLYPPVWLYSRRAIDEDTLAGYIIPANADIYLSPYILHRTAGFWPEPERFDPDRFAPDGRYRKGERPYFPFSLGPRRCLGEYFSFLEMKLHLGILIQRFHLHPVSSEPPGLNLGINLRSQRDILLKPEFRND
ncbi:MAG: cytochrome P450 [Woeseia sp.]